MNHLEDLSRARTKILYNLGPTEIAEREAQPFIIRLQIPDTGPKPAASLSKSKNRLKFVVKTKLSFSTALRKVSKDKEKTLIKPETSSKHSIHQAMHQERRKQRSLNLKGSPTHSEVSVSGASYSRTKGKPCEFNPYAIGGGGLWDAGCLTCGRDNTPVTYHGDRHVCVQCRKYIKTLKGDKALIYLDREGGIQCRGLKIVNGKEKNVLYGIEHDEMKIFEYKCYATYSGKDELIVLLQDHQTISRPVYDKESKLASFSMPSTPQKFLSQNISQSFV